MGITWDVLGRQSSVLAPKCADSCAPIMSQGTQNMPVGHGLLQKARPQVSRHLLPLVTMSK